MENIGALQLFSDCMKIFSLEQVDYFLGQLLKHYQKNSCSESMRERVAIICNNYLCYCYKQKLNGDNIEAALDYLASLETTTHFCFIEFVMSYILIYLVGIQKKQLK